MTLCVKWYCSLQFSLRVCFEWQFEQSIHNFYNETLQSIETSKPENKPDIFSCKILLVVEDNTSNNAVHYIAL